ncbi:MAG: helix-turn-helix domain-containing protein [Vicinamibacteria bacterium]
MPIINSRRDIPILRCFVKTPSSIAGSSFPSRAYTLARGVVTMAKSKSVSFSKKNMGERIRALRLQKGLTQVELGKKMGMTQSNISEIERGIRGLTVRQLLKLSSILSASTDTILLGSSSIENGTANLSLRVLRRAQRIQELPVRKQRALLETVDALLDKHQHS